jgi:ADP-ribosylglycohydrolase
VDRNRIKGGIVGICVGDAVGLPVEYRSRNYLKDDPVTEMIGFGTHNMPPGTWSGDSSLALCTTECLAEGFSLAGIAARLVMYADNACWAASDEPVELPGPLRTAIQRLTEPGAHLGVPADGNDNDMAFGVLPRILPVAATLRELSAEERFKRVAQVASLTNGHMKVVVGCHILTETAHGLIRSLSPVDAFRAMKVSVKRQLETEPALASYLRVLDGDLWALPEGEIVSDGKIVSTVEAALWCLLTSDGFAGAVLKAANLGGDTDTIGAVAGGLAGFAYGLDAIPPAWVSQLSRSNEILALAERLFKHVGIPK